ncbi:hypothetical protein PLCT2_02723 [Planctomycetaceae bacterium]|nr:hypothetical protein PLCT2_02723 [Planctomycetaceae bacterium]
MSVSLTTQTGAIGIDREDPVAGKDAEDVSDLVKYLAKNNCQ